MNRIVKTALTILVVVVGLSLLVWAFIGSRGEAQKEAERERPIEAPSRVATQNGEAVIRMDPSDQGRNGIKVTALKPSTQRDVVRATAVVLSAQDVIPLHENYAAKNGDVEKAQANLDVSRQEYERLKLLYQDERNTSLKALQAAEGTLHSDEATLKVARTALDVVEDNARQQWGATIANWIVAGSAELDALFKQKDLLIQVTFPPDSSVPAPPTALLEMPAGKMVTAKLVSPFPKIDPRIQGPSFLYIVAGQPGLVPGMSLAASLPSGAPLRGIVIPSPALIWSQGKSWVYVQTGSSEFVRREVSTDRPVGNGWFATQGFAPGQSVVVSGAQLLLSEEFRSQIQVGEENR